MRTLVILLSLLPIIASAAIFEDGTKIPTSEMTLQQLALVDSVASVVLNTADSLTQNPDGTWTMSFVRLSNQGIRLSLCPNEKYAEETRGKYAKSGAILIGPQHVLLAGHSMVSESDCQRKKIIFDLNDLSIDKSADHYTLPADTVYSCERIEWVRYDGNPATRPDNYLELEDGGLIDVAVIRLDRPVTVAKPARIPPRGSSPLQENEPLFFVSGMMGTLITGERVHIRQIADGGKVLGVQSDSSVGSSGGTYFDEAGYLQAIHIASGSSPFNWDTSYIDEEQECRRWIEVSSETADFKGKIKSPKRGNHEFPAYSVALTMDAIMGYIQPFIGATAQSSPSSTPTTLIASE